MHLSSPLSRRSTTWAALLVLLTTAAAAVAQEAAPATPEGGPEIARRFVELFVGKDFRQLIPAMDLPMKQAMTPQEAQRFYHDVRAQAGPPGAVGDPRLLTTTGRFRHYVVAVAYERQEVRFRVVIDQQDRVAGFYLHPAAEPGEGGPGSGSEAAAGPPAAVRELETAVGEGAAALPGTLTLPPGDPPFPGVVLVHGSGANDRDETLGPNKPFRDLAWGLAERGIASLRYDKRTYAAPRSLAGVETTVQEEVVDDARAALARLRERPEVAADRVFLFGHGLGGRLAPRIAQEGPRPAGLIVAAGGVRPIHEVVVEQIDHVLAVQGTGGGATQGRRQQVAAEAEALGKALAGEQPPPEATLLGVPFAYWLDLEAGDPVAAAKALALPVLVLQGGRDYQVTMEDFALWRQGLAGAPFACLVAYPDLDHLLHAGTGPSSPADYQRPAPVAEALIADVARWILQGTCPAPAGG